MVNIPLLTKTMECVEVEALRGHWDQGSWRRPIQPSDAAEERCGTALCFAGWTVALDGGRWLSVEIEL